MARQFFVVGGRNSQRVDTRFNENTMFTLGKRVSAAGNGE